MIGIARSAMIGIAGSSIEFSLIADPSSGVIPGSPGGRGVPGSGAAGGVGSGSAPTISSARLGNAAT